jgi:hypothetical protein
VVLVSDSRPSPARLCSSTALLPSSCHARPWSP